MLEDNMQIRTEIIHILWSDNKNRPHKSSGTAMNRHFIVTKMKNTVLLLILALFFISLRDDGLQMPSKFYFFNFTFLIYVPYQFQCLLQTPTSSLGCWCKWWEVSSGNGDLPQALSPHRKPPLANFSFCVLIFL